MRRVLLWMGVLAAVHACGTLGSGGMWRKRVATSSSRSIICARAEASRLGYGVRGGGNAFTAEKWFSDATQPSVGYISGYFAGDSLTLTAERRRSGSGGRFPVPQPPRQPAAFTGAPDTLIRGGRGSDQLPPGPVAMDASRIVSRCRSA